jgi:hypothetical protein
MRFRNVQGDGRWNQSETVRMHRLDQRGIMRMDGRVHEGFDAAVRHLRDEGYGGVLRTAPEGLEFVNTGLSRDPEAMQDKLDLYRDLVERDLREDPYRVSGWVVLGLYWLNEGFRTVALECFSRGMEIAQDPERSSYMPFQEAAQEYARVAHSAYAEAEARMGNHPGRQVMHQMAKMLGEAAPPLPVQGVPGRHGLTEAEALASLPPSPFSAD